MKRPVKTLLIWILLLSVVFAVFLNRNRERQRVRAPISAEEALAYIDSSAVTAYRIDDAGLTLVLFDGRHVTCSLPLDLRVYQRLQTDGIPLFQGQPSAGSDNQWLVWLITLALVLLAVLWFLRKFSGGPMNNIFELRKTKARAVEEVDKASFADIGGNREAVELLSDVVDFLKNPKRWTSAGARIPRGVLVVGPPGTGKTLLARAVAGETDSTFFYTSASEFVEMFVGVGAARVRDTFEKAAQNQPAVIFIDELDAIGRRRSSGLGTMHEEREQTLNQLLVLMDGLERYDRLVVMAATNRPDVLDPALMRSGRFDRMLRLSPPDVAERTEILRIHTRAKPLDVSVSLEGVAARTDGFTGADLESLTNEAALRAVRRARDNGFDGNNSVAISTADFEAAFESLTKSNRQFDRLDTVLAESVTQFAEPTGRAVAQVTLTTGTVVEGEVLWMNAGHMKLRTNDGSEVIVAKELAERIVPLEGTETTPQSDFAPDRWAGRDLDVG